MPITFKCTACKKPYKVSSKLAGKKIRCKQCNGVTRVPEVSAAPSPVAPAASRPSAKSGQPGSPVHPTQRHKNPPAAPQPVMAQPVVAEPVMATPVNQPDDDFVSIQTEWIVECDDCGRKHKPNEKLIGKRIRCKCGSVLHLTEHPGASIQMAPLEPEFGDLSDLPTYPAVAQTAQPVHGQAQVYQAPLPSFQHSQQPPQETVQSRRRREAEEMVRAADVRQTRRTQHLDDDDEEWGPLGKMIGGGAMIAGGGIWAFLAWQEGYIYPYSFILMGLGVLSLIMGLFESIT